MKKPKIKTIKEICDNANKIEYNLTNQEKKFTWWIKITKTVKAFYLRIKL